MILKKGLDSYDLFELDLIGYAESIYEEVACQEGKGRIGVDLAKIHKDFKLKVDEIFYLAHLSLPTNDFSIKGGKQGVHSENLGFILTEMQFLPSTYPEAIW